MHFSLSLSLSLALVFFTLFIQLLCVNFILHKTYNHKSHGEKLKNKKSFRYFVHAKYRFCNLLLIAKDMNMKLEKISYTII